MGYLLLYFSEKIIYKKLPPRMVSLAFFYYLFLGLAGFLFIYSLLQVKLLLLGVSPGFAGYGAIFLRWEEKK